MHCKISSKRNHLLFVLDYLKSSFWLSTFEKSLDLGTFVMTKSWKGQHPTVDVKDIFLFLYMKVYSFWKKWVTNLKSSPITWIICWFIHQQFATMGDHLQGLKVVLYETGKTEYFLGFWDIKFRHRFREAGGEF